MDKVNYETYDTDAEYDDMDGTSAAQKANVSDATPQPQIESVKSGNKKVIILLLLIILFLLLVTGGAVGLILKKDLKEVEDADCDVGPWGAWTPCYLPPGTCGIGEKNRTRDNISDSIGNGLKCAKSRIIEVAETINCNVACKLPVDCEVGDWGSWTSCSATCGGGIKERTREKLADAENNGTSCVSTRKMIPLKETNTCNNLNCTSSTIVLGAKMLHASNGYGIYMVPVGDGLMLTSTTVVATCRLAQMEAVCSGPSSCQYTDTSKCLVLPLENDCFGGMDGVSRAICNGASPSSCPQIDGLFNYMKDWQTDSACGVVSGGWCVKGKDYQSTDGKPLYAYCAKRI